MELAPVVNVFSGKGSALTGIGLTTIREAISNGTLVAHKQGTRTIILPDDLTAWLKVPPKTGNKSASREQALIPGSICFY
jgi:excisionase family DNA binding protein